MELGVCMLCDFSLLYRIYHTFTYTKLLGTKHVMYTSIASVSTITFNDKAG